MIITTEKYKDLTPLSGEANAVIAHKIISEFESKGDDEMHRRYGFSKKAGGVFILDSPTRPGYVVEHIPGLNGDSVSTLFANNALFNAPSDLIRVREDLIDMIERAENASPGKLVIQDAGRGRRCFLPELSTAQLLDLVQRAVNKGRVSA